MYLPDYIERSLLNTEVRTNWNKLTIKEKHCYTLKINDKHPQTYAAHSIDDIRQKLKKDCKNFMHDFRLIWPILGKAGGRSVWQVTLHSV